MTPPEASLDPSVCYRHPDRESWTLCQRCGRTICPECQILTPSGVRCPDCVRETGGSVQWTPTSSAPQRASAAKARARAGRERPQWVQTVLEYVRPPGSSGVGATWIIMGIVVVQYVFTVITADLTFRLLYADPTVAWQAWRFITAAIAYPTAGILSLILNLVFLVLIARPFEAQVGQRVFLWTIVPSAMAATALSLLAGFPSSGLTAPLFGLIGATIVMVWSIPQVRNRQLIFVGIILLISIVLGGVNSLLPIVGGLLAGSGAMYLLRRYQDAGVRQAHLLIAGGTGALVVLAIIRSLVFR